MSDDGSADGVVQNEYHAICPLCVRVVTKQDRQELRGVVDNHNEARHDGERVAQFVEAWELDDWLNRVEAQHGKEVCQEIGTHIVKKDPWGVL
jgi:hypothetical protein